MSDNIGIRMVWTKPIDATVREWRHVLKTTMMDLGLYWWRTYASGHFKKGAEDKYGYKPRTEKYLRSKDKWGKPPLLLTGANYNAVVKRTPTIAAYPTRATFRWSTPDYAQMRPATADKPNLGKEITAVTPGERVDLALYVRRRIAERLWKLTLSPKYLTIR